MPATYDGDASGITNHEDVTISEPADGDLDAAATFTVAYEKLADYLQYLQENAALLSTPNDFVGPQSIVNNQVGTPALSIVGANSGGGRCLDLQPGDYDTAPTNGAVFFSTQLAPSAALNGEVWLESTGLRIKLGGVVYNLNASYVAAASFNSSGTLLANRAVPGGLTLGSATHVTTGVYDITVSAITTSGIMIATPQSGGGALAVRTGSNTVRVTTLSVTGGAAIDSGFSFVVYQL